MSMLSRLDNRRLHFYAVIALLFLFSIAAYASLDHEQSNIQGQAIKHYLLDFDGRPVDVESGLRLGVLTTSTGPYGFIGKQVVRGVELGRQVIEEKTGIPVHVEYRDTRCDDDLALLQVIELRDWNPDLVLVADCYKTGDHLISQGLYMSLKPSYSDKGHYSFSDDVDAQVERLFKSVNPDMESLAIIFSDDEYGHAYKDSLVAAFREKYARHVDTYAYDVNYPSGLPAFKISQQQHDAVFIIGVLPSDIIYYIEELREKDYYNQVFTNYPLSEQDMQSYDPLYFESVIIISDYNPGSKRDVVKGFRQDMLGLYGTEPSLYSARAYDSMLVVAAALAYGTDGLSERIGTVRNIEGVTGVVSADRLDLSSAYRVLTIKDGRPEYLD